MLVRDLGSSNGVRVNGVKVTRALLLADDLVSFGEVLFRIGRTHQAAPRRGVLPAGGSARLDDQDPPGALVRTVDVRSGGAVARLRKERLERLIELAGALSGPIDLADLLPTVVAHAAELLPVDRVALLLVGEAGGELEIAHWQSRVGNGVVRVPKSIVERALKERAPIVTENAQEDTRFQSDSVVQERVRAALCVPLLTDQDALLGALYLDSLTALSPSRPLAFSDEDAALALAFGGLVAVTIAKVRYADAARREAVARANLERFFAPAVAARIATRHSGARPGGERRAVTLLYSDVRGFTGLAETLPPEAVAEQLSEYFAAMVELVFEHGGTLDKFMGDALLAFWGAPQPLENAAERALAAARAMLEQVEQLNARWSAAVPPRPELAVGIGVHHGEAFAGTIGSPRRLEYTVIGDVVNVAARLSDAAAPGEIVLSDAARAELRGTVSPSGPERLTVAGREEPVQVYRLRKES